MQIFSQFSFLAIYLRHDFGLIKINLNGPSKVFVESENGFDEESKTTGGIPNIVEVLCEGCGFDSGGFSSSLDILQARFQFVETKEIM